MRTKLRIIKVILAIVLGVVFLPTNGLFGADCNGYDGLDTDDVVYLITYFYSGGDPPPDPIACDCDGYPGVTIAEIPHIAGALFQGCSLYPAVGPDMLVPSDVRVWPIGKPDGVNVFSARIFIRTAVDIDELAIPFSYAAEPGQSDLICTSVDFTGSVANPDVVALIRDDQKMFILLNADGIPDAVSAGSEGLLCTAHFGLAGPAGDPVTLKPTFNDRFSPLLVMKQCFDGVVGERIFYPAFMPPPIGDCNCDDIVDIDDAVWLISYIFQNGPEPYDCY